jgi:hypothetical protein
MNPSVLSVLQHAFPLHVVELAAAQTAEIPPYRVTINNVPSETLLFAELWCTVRSVQ